jgi:hypothetical protein
MDANDRGRTRMTPVLSKISGGPGKGFSFMLQFMVIGELLLPFICILILIRTGIAVISSMPYNVNYILFFYLRFAQAISVYTAGAAEVVCKSILSSLPLPALAI